MSVDDRGQTTLDFATGVGTFLLAVVFVFAFVPGMFQPFDGSPDGTLVADRAADTLASDLLGDPHDPSVLNATCTAEFFDADTATGGCRYAADAADLHRALGLKATRRINVTLAHDGAVRYSAGNDPMHAEDVTVGQRLAFLDGESYRLEVRVW